ncbi:MAG: response regulator [Eudoraea sp.]|nr:response regulator [Eudoraea sp.]
MKKIHRLLKRQLSKFDLDRETQEKIAPLLTLINEAYHSFDHDLLHVENILERSSRELYEANKQLKSRVETISGQLSKIAENISEVIFEVDMKGNWCYLNSAWEKLTGVAVDKTLGNPYYRYLKDENDKPIKLTFNFDKDSGLFNQAVKCLTLNGDMKWLDITSKAVRSDSGKIEGYIGSIVDVTEQKNAELALIQAKEKATIANKAKDEFLSTMSHEIRTPLNAVIGVSHLLMMEDPKKEQLENLKALKYSSEHLLSLVNDILDFNKIASGSLELEEADFSLDQILDGLKSIFERKAHQKNITFVIRKGSNVPDVLLGDTTRLTQILTNLVNNGIKFTKRGGVVLEVSNVSQNDAFTELQFEVEDTGIGISDYKKEQIFRPFAQAETNTTRKYGGTGLGLSISKQLLEIMDSELQLESEEEVGSVFSFTLKYKKSCSLPIYDEARDEEMVEKVFSSLQGMHVLVVDDNRLNTMVVQKMLSKWDADFEIAENGLVALKKASETRYDLILMDLQMPVMNGYEASKSIRETHNSLNKDVPIYALSASTGANILEEIEAFGMDGLIHKPFKPHKLYDILFKIMRNKPVH